MTDEQNLAPEASDEVVHPADEQEQHTPETEIEGQVETPPEEGDGEEAEAKGMSKSQARREKRKAYEAELQVKEQAAREEADAATAKLERMQEAAKSLKKPTQDDFPDYEDYTAALSAYHSVVALDARDLKALEDSARQSDEQVKRVKAEKAAEASQNWEAQKAEGVAKYPDFERVALSEDMQISPALGRLIIQSDVAADLAYAMGKTPALAKSLSGQSPMDMARAVGRLEAQVSASTPPPPSNAPEPINPVRGKATARKHPGDMDPQEYRAWSEAGGTF